MTTVTTRDYRYTKTKLLRLCETNSIFLCMCLFNITIYKIETMAQKDCYIKSQKRESNLFCKAPTDLSHFKLYLGGLMYGWQTEGRMDEWMSERMKQRNAIKRPNSSVKTEGTLFRIDQGYYFSINLIYVVC